MQYKTRAELKDLAKENLRGHYGSAIMTFLVPAALGFVGIMPVYFLIIIISAVVMLLNGEKMNVTALSLALYPIQAVSTVFIAMFNAGIALFYLNLACKKRHSVSDLFFGFRWQFKKTLILAAVQMLVSLIPLLPYQIFITLNNTNPKPLWLILAFAAYVLGTAVSLPISLMLSQTFYLLLDFPRYSAKQILQLSIRLMRGNKWRLFMLKLSFIPMELLGILSCGIGYLWINPYMYMTHTHFFLDLMKPTHRQTSSTASAAPQENTAP